MPPKKLTVLVDSREQFPLLFPATVLWFPTRSSRPFYMIHIATRVERMDTADYALDGYEDTCMIERKGAQSELATNLCSKDYARAHAAFKRLAEETTHPYIVLEETPAGMFPMERPSRPNPDRVMDAFIREVCTLKIPLIFAGRARSPGHRRKLGHFILKIMLYHAMEKNRPYSALTPTSPPPIL